MSGRLFLLDGTLLFFRALHGLPDVFQDGRGRSINGVRGYLNFLLKLLLEHEVGRCAVAFDESLTSCWRNAHFPEYKANRAPADDNIRTQLTLCRRVTALLEVPVVADPAYEADDFIATLCRRSNRAITIVSRDKDLQQLLNERVELLDPGDDSVTTVGSFRARLGFDASSFPDYQALTGDAVDNIPGVRGVGPKSARRLIETFGDLDTLYRSADAWPQAGVKAGSRMAENLLDQREQAFLFRRILRLDHQAPVPFPMRDLKLRRPSPAAVRSALDSLGLRDGLGRSIMGLVDSYCV